MDEVYFSYRVGSHVFSANLQVFITAIVFVLDR